jgi:hypothetical protein
MIHTWPPFFSYAPAAFGILGIVSAADSSRGESKAFSTNTMLRSTPASTSDQPPGPVDAPRKPPQAAFDACKSAREGDTCSVSFNGHTVTGTCRKGPSGEEELACVPARPPGPPPSSSRNSATSGNNSRQTSMIGSGALEHQLDQLEREINES